MRQELTVYVVDDSRDAADSMAALVQALGHLAQPFYAAREVLEVTREVKPDCVILDVAMAGMDGLALARRLRAEFADEIILVAVTGTPQDDPAVAATFGVVDHWFLKPVTLDKLKRLLMPNAQ